MYIPPTLLLRSVHLLSARWPEVAALCRSFGPLISAFRAAASALNCEIRVSSAAACLDSLSLHGQCCSPDIMIDTLARQAREFLLFTDTQCVISELIPAMCYAWHITNELHLHALMSIIGSSVGITAIWKNGLVVGQPLPSPALTTSITAPSTSSGALVTFEHSSSMFMASLGQGWPGNTALRGPYSSNGKFFRPMPAHPSTASSYYIILPGTISEHPTTILWDGTVILAISSTSVLRIKTTGKHN